MQVRVITSRSDADLASYLRLVAATVRDRLTGMTSPFACPKKFIFGRTPQPRRAVYVFWNWRWRIAAPMQEIAFLSRSGNDLDELEKKETASLLDAHIETLRRHQEQESNSEITFPCLYVERLCLHWRP